MDIRDHPNWDSGLLEAGRNKVGTTEISALSSSGKEKLAEAEFGGKGMEVETRPKGSTNWAGAPSF
ncbi:hypothetical protein AUK22_09635 [bacterium CG2_30_54_10]|nr:MAG: hypothetical protein AUK22_09635 [bacterium CG2_30_54_10]